MTLDQKQCRGTLIALITIIFGMMLGIQWKIIPECAVKSVLDGYIPVHAAADISTASRHLYLFIYIINNGV